MESLEIVRVQQTEVALLCRLGRSTFENTYALQNNPSDFEKYLDAAFSKTLIASQLNDPAVFYFFAKLGSDIVGYLKLNTGKAQTEYKESEGIEIERIYIVSELQGIGLGKQLIQFAEAYGKERDKTYIWLGVWERNSKAIAFYHKTGFKKTDTHIYPIGNDPQTDIIMRKSLVK